MPATSRKKKAAARPKALPKCPTGIKGFDEVRGGGGLPKDRTTLVCGGAGSGGVQKLVLSNGGVSVLPMDEDTPVTRKRRPSGMGAEKSIEGG